MMHVSRLLMTLLALSQSESPTAALGSATWDVSGADCAAITKTLSHPRSPLSDELKEKYKRLGFPFDEWRLYPALHLDLIAEEILSFLDGYDPQNDRNGTDPQRAPIVASVRDEIERARNTNDKQKIVQIFNISHTDSDGDNQVRLAAAFYVAERLKLVEPMDVFLEYAWVKVAKNPKMEALAGSLNSEIDIKYTGEREVMMFPAAAAILHAYEKSFPGLCQIIGNASQPEHQRLKAAAFLKSLNVSAESSIIANPLKNCDEEMALAVTTIVGYRSPMGGGYSWRHAPTSIKRLYLELANEIRYTRTIEQKFNKN